MKYLLLLSYIALFMHHVNSNNVVSPPVEAVLRHMFEIMKEVKQVNKTVEQGVVELDNLHFEDQHVKLCGPILCISANLTDGTLSGLGGFEALKSEFVTDGPKVTLDIDVNFPSLLLESEYYEMKGNIMKALPLAGHGKLHLEIKHLRLWTKIILKIADDGTSIEEFENSGFNIQNIYSRTEFDGNIDAIFNSMVEELLVYYLNRLNTAIATYYCQAIKELLNPII